MDRCDAAPAEVRALCEAAATGAARSINLLNNIERTVNWLSWIRGHAEADLRVVAAAGDHFKNCDRAVPIDVDHALVQCLESTEGIIDGLYRALIAKRHAARQDPALYGDPTVNDEYTTTIHLVALLHNAFCDLRWSIMEHDADLETNDGQAYSDANDLIAALNA